MAIETYLGRFQKGIRYSRKTEFTKGFTPWNKGRKCPELSGNKHPMWTGATICECGNQKSAPANNCRTCANEKISLRMKGNKHGQGHIMSAETRKKQREARIKNPTSKFKDTKIERIIESLLIESGIPFKKQIPLCKVTVTDFYLEGFKIAIFCDGCYWHGCRKHRSIDKVVELNKNQNKILIKNGFSVLRFWEHEINSKPEDCISKIINLINLKSNPYGYK